MCSERWLPISGYEGLYEISDTGRVKSLTKGLGSRKKAHETERILQGWLKAKDHYLQVRLYEATKHKTFMVHHLVLEHFVGPRPDGMNGLHSDDNKANNCATNLYWGTKKQNAEDRRANGHMTLEHLAHGASHGMVILLESQVVAIRNRYAAGGVTQKTLAEGYGVSTSTICAIINRRFWKHC